MLRLALAAVLLAIFVSWMPAAALADSAGDNQYQDPFSNLPAQPKKQKSTTTTPAQTPAPAQAPAAAPTPTATTATPGASGSDTLPRTGFPLVPVAIVGGALIAAGLAIRRLA